MIIWLNGPSSSGKTTLARKLQETLPNMFLHGELDKFISMMPQRIQENRREMLDCLDSVISPFHKSLNLLADAGNNLIVDHVFEKKEWFVECRDLFNTFPICSVGLTAPLEVLLRREEERQDRQNGLSESHLSIVHTFSKYDLFLDSDKNSSSNMAELIIEYLNTQSLNYGLIGK